MNIIFLDIDGVLNSRKFFKERTKYISDTTLDMHVKDLDTKAVQLLNKLIKDTNAKIVISSTWRYDMTNTVDALKIAGLEDVENVIIGRTDKIGDNYCVRGNEILKWIKDNKEIVGDYCDFENCVILDDDSDMLYQQKDNFVHTDNNVGLTIDDVEKAIVILNNNKEIKNEI